MATLVAMGIIVILLAIFLFIVLSRFFIKISGLADKAVKPFSDNLKGDK